MPVRFNPTRPMCKQEFEDRRNITTKEELAKLMSSTAYKRWRGSGGMNILNPRMAVAVLLAISLIAFAAGKRSARPARILQPSSQLDTEIQHASLESQQMPESNHFEMPGKKLEPWMLMFSEGISCGEERSELQHTVSLISRQLSATKNELTSVLDTNDRLAEQIDVLSAAVQQHQQIASCPYQEEYTVHSTSTSLAPPIFLAIVAVSTAIAVRVVFSRKRATARAADSQNAEVAAKLQDALFGKEMAEQSLTILEQELQRKMEQLSQVKEQLKVAASSAAAATPSSPRIRAVQPRLPEATGSPATSPGGTSVSPGRELPPPPQQLVERFLMERGAVAIEEEQVHSWLEMEGRYGRLVREVGKLRAAVEGRDTEAKMKSEELAAMAAALDVARKQTRTAKQALHAVKAVAASASAGAGGKTVAHLPSAPEEQ